MAKNRQLISLRVDSTLERELAFIKKTLKLNNSRAIRDAIHFKYCQLKEATPTKTPVGLLETMKLVGAIDGPEDLSSNYKKEILKSIRKKHDLK